VVDVPSVQSLDLGQNVGKPFYKKHNLKERVGTRGRNDSQI